MTYISLAHCSGLLNLTPSLIHAMLILANLAPMLSINLRVEIDFHHKLGFNEFMKCRCELSSNAYIDPIKLFVSAMNCGVMERMEMKIMYATLLTTKN